MPKNAFFTDFFKKFSCGAESFAKIGAKQCFGRAQKINLVDLKKKGRQNFGKFFENPPPPLEKILDPPLILTLFFLRVEMIKKLIVDDFQRSSFGLINFVQIRWPKKTYHLFAII